MANRLMFNGVDKVGMYCKLTNTYCLVGEGSDDFYSEVVAEFEDIIPVIKTSIGGFRHVGRYCIGNKNGLLLPHTTTPEEYQHIRRSLPHATVLRRIPEGLTCYARFIACNDHVALAHTELHQEVEELLNDVLKVEVFKPKDPDSIFSGTYCALSNIGGLIHPDASQEVLDELSEYLDVPFKAGTVNDGSVTLFPGITVNDWTAFCGSTTTNAELQVEVINVFRQMLLEGEKPDFFSISAILSGVSSLDVGVQVHGWVIRQGVEWSLSIANSLIVVYSNHGKLDKARSIFNQMPEKDIVSWNSIISAHCKHPEAIAYFEKMEEADVNPDKITFVSLISACAHLGLVNDGERLFALMCEKYKIKPIMEHYGCMVNLYGRAGLIEKAYSIIVDGMGSEAAGPTLWGALLYACFLKGNVTIGEISANKLFELEPDNEHNFVLLMKIYENTGRLEDMERIRKMLADRGLDH